ncbi:MAG: hypothetical protein ACQEUI_12150 [Actinomycetota bacterium]
MFSAAFRRAEEPTCVQHTLQLTSTSTTDDQRLQELTNLFSRLSMHIDPAHDSDIQLVEVSVRVTGAQGHFVEVQEYAEAIGADRREEEELT